MANRIAFVLRIDKEQITRPIDASFAAFFNARRQDGIKVALEIRGYDKDSCELYEISEVREWMRALFIRAMPEALATLALAPEAGGLSLVQACCNDTRRYALGISMTILPAWLDACAQAGIEVAHY